MTEANLEESSSIDDDLVILKCKEKEITYFYSSLCELSPYFLGMLKCKMKECLEKFVDMSFLDEETFLYLFSQEVNLISLKKTNVMKIFQAADYFYLDNAVHNCLDYLQNSIDTGNALAILQFLEPFEYKRIIKFIKCYIRRNFEAIIEKNEDVFFHMSYESLSAFLGCTHLNVSSEEALLRIKNSWINYNKKSRLIYDKEMSSLIQMTKTQRCRLETPTLVTLDEFLDMKDKDMIEWSIINGRKQGKLNGKNSLRWNIVSDNKSIYVIDPCLDSFFYLDIFNEEKEQSWKVYKNSRNKIAFPGLAIGNGDLYLSGGSCLTNYSSCSSLTCFKRQKTDWCILSNDMIQPREAFVMAILDNFIYIIGGSIKKQNKWYDSDNVERYDLISKQWKALPSMHSKRSSSTVVVFYNKIYVIGGYNGSYPLKTMEYYDTLTNQWIKCADMMKGRDGIGVAIVENFIYAVGGKIGEDSTDCVERYDIALDKWEIVPDMKSLLHNIQVIIW